MFQIAIAAAVASAATPTQGGSILRLNAGQVMSLADEAGKRSDLATAEEAYRALTNDANPDVRAEALFRHALMLAQAGQLTRAASLFRRLLDERPKAARARLEFANLLVRMGDQDSALRELRAAQASGLPPDVARVVDRYFEALRAARPIGASLEIAIAPDSNVSRSTSSDTLGTVFGDFEIDEDSKAKSGTGLSIRGQAFRRFGIDAGDTNLLVRLTGTADLYRRSRFDDIALDLALGPELQLGRNRVTAEAGVTQRWFGLDPYMRSARINAILRRPLDGRTLLRLAGSASLIDNRRNALQDGKSLAVQVGVERALSATTGLALNLSLDRFSARDPGYSTTGWRGALLAWRDVGRATLTAGVEIGRLRADERLLLFPDKRSDKYGRLSFGATFRQLSFGGFAPVARLVIERNRSTIEFYDYRRMRTEFGLVRAF